MELLLVRHGQTGGNVARRHQAPDTPLTQHGREQAVATAKEVAALEPTHLLSSANVRAIETARAIAAQTGLDMTVDARFVELYRPPRLYGHYRRSCGSFFFYLRWYFGLTPTDEDPENGESYREFRERLHEARKRLLEYPSEARVVVVSHAVFIAFFEAHLKHERALGLLAALRTFYRVLTIENASVTKVVLD